MGLRDDVMWSGAWCLAAQVLMQHGAMLQHRSRAACPALTQRSLNMPLPSCRRAAAGDGAQRPG